MSKTNFYNVAQAMFRFEEFLIYLENQKLSAEDQELLVKILDQWSKHKMKKPENKKLALLIKGFAGFYK